jgi:hypothetical protein
MSQKQTAVVDAKSVYLGMFDEGAEIPAGARRISEITDCDLAIGQYFWNGLTFLPRSKGGTASVSEQPEIIPAIYDCFLAIQRQGIDLPPSTKKWMEFFSNSIDNMGR